jgi:hypothetical protein
LRGCKFFCSPETPRPFSCFPGTRASFACSSFSAPGVFFWNVHGQMAFSFQFLVCVSGCGEVMSRHADPQ